MSDRYTFTRAQLTLVLSEAIGLFIEYRDQYGHDEIQARPLAVGEVLEGLDAERDLLAYGDLDGATLQEMPDDGASISERLSVGRKDKTAND